MSLKDAIQEGKKLQRENRELSDTDKWTPARIRKLIRENDVFVERALCVLLKRQNPMEQQVKHTMINNNMGFTSSDAKFLTGLADQILETSKYPIGKKLSKKQMPYARSMLMKYSTQLAVYANHKDVVRVERALGIMNIENFRKGGTYGKVEQAGDEENVSSTEPSTKETTDTPS